MAKNSITDYDNTSGNNTDVQSVDISEGCSPSGINNAIREVMADLADVNDGTVALTSPQAANMTVTGTVTTDTIAENTSAAGVTIDGVLLKDGGVDVNGNELILDADGDTSITADTDDQIDFKTGGSDRMVIDSSGNVTLNNAKYLQFKDSGGTARDVLTIDAYNGLNINSAGGGSAAPIVFKANNTETMRLDSSGKISVNTSSVAGTGWVQINAVTADSVAMRFKHNGATVGSISTTASATAYNTSSDYRLKENVTDITGATERLKQLNPVRFNFIADADTTVDGFLAHEVQDVVPEAITGTKDGMRDEEYEVTPAVLDEDGNEVTPAVMGTRSVPDYQGIDQSKLVPLLVATIQELEARIAALESA